MDVVLIILGTLLADWLLGYLFNYTKKKELKRDNDLFQFKLEQILSDENKSNEIKKENALELCRMTKGEIAAGAYFVLDWFECHKKL